jgi:hypothetical protein
MAIIKGPFSIKWGQNTIEDIEDISIEHSIDSEDFQTIQGKTIELDGAYKVTATITLLASDIPVLAVLLPQHFVAMGSVLSTGETVTNAAGAIDIKAAECDEAVIDNDLDIISCADTARVLRLVECRTKIESVEIDSKVQKVIIKFVGNASVNEATMQFFMEGGIEPES